MEEITGASEEGEGNFRNEIAPLSDNHCYYEHNVMIKLTPPTVATPHDGAKSLDGAGVALRWERRSGSRATDPSGRRDDDRRPQISELDLEEQGS